MTIGVGIMRVAQQVKVLPAVSNHHKYIRMRVTVVSTTLQLFIIVIRIWRSLFIYLVDDTLISTTQP